MTIAIEGLILRPLWSQPNANGVVTHHIYTVVNGRESHVAMIDKGSPAELAARFPIERKGALVEPDIPVEAIFDAAESFGYWEQPQEIRLSAKYLADHRDLVARRK